MNFLKTIAATACVLVAGTSVNAASWNFGDDAQTFRASSGYEGTFDQVYSGADAVSAGTAGKNTNGGVTLSTSAELHLGGEAHPFMDAFSGSKPAGLGVCSSGFFPSGISDCSSGFGGNTGDDNLMFPELLTLTFDRGVVLSSMFIRDTNHNVVQDGSITFAGTHPAGPLIVLDIVGGFVQNLGSLGYATSFTLSGTDETPQLYIDIMSASVPLPAAGWLLLGGLGGIMAIRRKKS